MTQYEFHKLANLFPLLTGDEYDELCKSMADGYLPEYPIVLYENKILDGRNRYIACQKTGVEPVFTAYTGGDPLGFVVKSNLSRRHLTSSQRAMIALDVERELATNAEKRMLAGKKLDPSQIFEQGKSAEKAAEIMGTNRQYVSDAKKIAEQAPELAERVLSGEMSIPEAKRIINRQERIERVQQQTGASDKLPATRYPVIYADPPWRYEYSISNSREIENNYPTMELQDICNLDISSIACTDAVLFMWATNPKLQEAMQVIAAWGFEYRTNIVWVKDKIGMGYYVRQKHELLLIATRGNLPTPEPQNRPQSVIESPRTQHSKKPDEAYEILERMYPELPKIELFARQEREGWSAWGNQL